MCDIEADFFELFAEHRKNPCLDLLIRAQTDRSLEDETTSLFDTIRQAPVLSEIQVSVPRKSARPKKSKQKAIAFWVIHAQEMNPPENVNPIEWIVLTTIECSLAADGSRTSETTC